MGSGRRRTHRSASGTVVVVAVVLVLSVLIASSSGPISGAGAASVPSWSVMAGTSSSSNDRLVDVSCSSATACTAVGYSDTTPFNQATSIHQVRATSLQGSTWVATAPVDVATDDQLRGVSCASATFCMAVGHTGNTNAPTPNPGTSAFAERWDGSSWTMTTTPPLADSALNGVSCPSTTRCVAVGYQGAGGSQSLVESWDGAVWTVASVPVRSASEGLAGVSCPTVSSCMAVGASSVPSSTPLVMVWDGSLWASAPAPPPGPFAALVRVSCTTATSCMAVGTGGNFPSPEPTAAWWNGATWSVGSVPAAGAVGDLQGVSCATATSCVAVGETSDASFSTLQPVADRWDGSVWVQTNLVPPGADANLAGVDCVAPGTCVAAGLDQQRTTPVQELVEQMVPNSSTGIASASPTSLPVHQPVALTDTVTTSSADPGGTVTFSFAGSPLCVAPVVAGAATCPTSVLPVGSDQVTAFYSGDSSDGSSAASTTVAVLAQVATYVVVDMTPPGPVGVGAPVTYGATVTSLGGTVGGGTVTFTAGATSLCAAPVVRGRATCVGTAAPVGVDTVTASFGGTPWLLPSTGTGSLTVNTSGATLTTVTASPGIAPVGTSVTFAASVTAPTGVPTGSVVFAQFGTALCTATLAAGSASCVSAAALVGNATVITATYAGDASDNGSSGQTTLTVLPPVATTTTLSVRPGPVMVGTTSTYTATVTPLQSVGPLGGVVTMTVASGVLCSAPLVGGVATCTASTAPVGNDAVSAAYGGSASYAGSFGSAGEVVTRAPGVRCSGLSGRTKGFLTFTRCTPRSLSDKKAVVLASLLAGSGSVVWMPTGDSSDLSVTAARVGQGACASGATEIDVVGYVSGGTSTYAPTYDPVSFRACAATSGKLTLVPGTTVQL